MPGIKLNIILSIVLTIIIMCLLLLIEFMVIKLCYASPKNNYLENFNEEQCPTCKPPQQEQSKCRVVCDSDKDKEKEKEVKEGFKNIESMENTPPAEETPKVEPNVNQVYRNRSYDDRFGFGGMFYDEYPYSLNLGTDKGELVSDRERERRENLALSRTKQQLEDRASTTKAWESPYQEPGELSVKRNSIEYNKNKIEDIDNDLPYSDYNHLPVASGYKSTEYEYGYSYIPPEKWYPQPPRPPICISDRKALVMPMYTQGTPVDVKEFHSSRKFSPPNMINTDYLQNL